MYNVVCVFSFVGNLQKQWRTSQDGSSPCSTASPNVGIIYIHPYHHIKPTRLYSCSLPIQRALSDVYEHCVVLIAGVVLVVVCHRARGVSSRRGDRTAPYIWTGD